MLRRYYVLLAAIRSLLARRVADQVQADLQFHIEQSTAEYIEQGLSPNDARAAALRAFGNPTQVFEEVRDMSFWLWWDRLVQDLRYGLRTFRRNPVFSLTALLSLALGIGANTAVFSVVNAALLRPLPVDRPDQLVLLNPRGDFSYLDYIELRESNRVFSDLLAASRTRRTGVVVAGESEQALVKMVSGNYFEGLGVPPAAGRVLTPADEQERVVVISPGYWSRRFDRSSDVVGRPITVDGLPFTIVGVASDRFLSEAAGEAPDIWTSIALQLPARRDERGYSWLSLMGRMKPAVTRQQAQSELNALLTGALGDGARRIDVAAGSQGVARLRNMFADPLRVLMAVAGVVLLIACTNLGSLLLTRGAAREAEISMRLAIGASRARIVRQLMTESLMLALGGGVIGLVFAAWGSAALVRMVSAVGETLVLDLGPDLRVLVFTAATSVAAAVLFGLAPALRTVRHAVISPSEQGHRLIGGGSRWRTRDVLIVAQLALSVLLLALGVMFSRTLSNLENQDLGFAVDAVVMTELAPERGYRPVLPSLIPRLYERLESVPGVTSATVVFNGPLGAGAGVYGLEVDGYTPQSAQDQRARADWVGPNYFSVTGIPLTEGRDFSFSDDGASPKVAIINQTMARHYFGDRPALGRYFTFNKNRYEIVGIARNAKDTDLRQVTPRVVYFPVLQGGGGPNALVLRLAGIPSSTVSAPVRAAIREVDPRLSAREIVTMSTRMHRTLIREHLLADLAGFFSGLTLLLAAIGVYGTLAYSAARRTKEIGIRLALGSRRAAVVWIVLRGIVVRLAIGLAIGLVGAILAGRLIASMLFGMGPADPVTLGVATITLTVVSLAAGYLPACRASRLDPVAVLRE
jgi:predicted permease